ncbi:MAG: TonB-dependent receptor [Pseudomonadota bacterium]
MRCAAITVLMLAVVANATPAKASAIDEIVISAVRGETDRPISTVNALDAADLTAIRAVSLDEALARLPSAAVSTNSRGETLVFLRGAGERQTALFFDGAVINVPWDNRFDISLFPARAVSDITAMPGVSSVLFGANASGGVIEIIAPHGEDSRSAIDVQGGEGGFVDGGGSVSGRVAGVSTFATAGATRRDGVPLSGDAILPFSQPPGATRINTDLNRATALGRVVADVGRNAEISASLLYVDAEFGIAPEGHLDPEESRVRFWRFPDSRHLVGVLGGKAAIAPKVSVSGAFWVQQFNQTIESYASNAFQTIDDVQVDSDRTYGFRGVVEANAGAHTWRGVSTVIDARHRQTDIAFNDGAPPPLSPDADEFRQRIVSVGGEYELAGDAFRFLFGASGDFTDALETGGRASAGDFAAWNIIGGARRRFGDHWTASVSAGRKTRLPTQRELFGESVGRFIVNPDLKPESAVLVEAPVRFERRNVWVAIAPFANFTTNTIDQQVVDIEGIAFRQRINLRGSRAFGIELSGAAQLTERLAVDGNLSALRLRRRVGAGFDATRVLAERPSLLARAQLRYAHPTGWGASWELLRRGSAFSLDDEGAFVPLERSTSFNAELSYAFNASGVGATAFMRADNLTDALAEPQLGLPAAGRLLRIGVRVAR